MASVIHLKTLVKLSSTRAHVHFAGSFELGVSQPHLFKDVTALVWSRVWTATASSDFS